MSNINTVLEGKNKGSKITGGTVLYANEWLSKYTVASYQVIDETNKDQYSFWKGALGVALLGNIGAVVGIGGKNKKEYLIEIKWKNGDKSLIFIDENYYKIFIKSMF